MASIYSNIQKWNPPKSKQSQDMILDSVTDRSSSIRNCEEANFELIIPKRFQREVLFAFGVAGENGRELKRAILHFKNNPKKLEAICFLVQETVNRRYLEYPGNSWESKPIGHLDATCVSAEYLIQNVELAFEAIDRFPWANETYKRDRKMFFSGVLPYRIGTGSLNQLGNPNVHWRNFLLNEKIYNMMKEELELKTSYSELRERLSQFSERYQQAHSDSEKLAVIKDVIAYFDIEFLHNNEGARYFSRGPEELSIRQFMTAGVNGENKTRGGRCTDLDNVLRMCLMSVGIPTTATRIIAWPNGDSNHEILSWNLFGERFDLNAITSETRSDSYLTPFKLNVAKVYQEDWGDWSQSSSITSDLKQDEKLPWHIGFYLGTRSMKDVTGQYTKTATIKINGTRPGALAYLGVFNNSSDIQTLGIAAVAAGRSDKNGGVKFENVGTQDILYFAFYYDEIGGEPAAEIIGKPFIAHSNGKLEFLSEEKKTGETYVVDLNEKFGKMKPEHSYVLMTFSGGRWVEKENLKSDNEGNLRVNGIQSGVLYVLRDEENGLFLRPFVRENDGRINTY